MALRKPLVVSANGRYEELPAADTLDAAVAEKDVVTLTNSQGSIINKCQPVYAFGAGTVKLAKADAEGTAGPTVGLVADASIADTASGTIFTDGVLSATTGQWDAVTGGVGGLTPGTQYFLSTATAGNLQTTVASTANHCIVKIGTAVSATEMEVSIEFIAIRR